MVSKNEYLKCQRLLKVIYENGEITWWDLIDKAKMSLRDYQALKKYFSKKYGNAVKYEKSEDLWIALDMDLVKKLQEGGDKNIDMYLTKEIPR